ncbi:unnamed protein product [Gordionus sp. m RMFG-2023]
MSSLICFSNGAMIKRYAEESNTAPWGEENRGYIYPDIPYDEIRSMMNFLDRNRDYKGSKRGMPLRFGRGGPPLRFG